MEIIWSEVANYYAFPFVLVLFVGLPLSAIFIGIVHFVAWVFDIKGE